MIISIVAAAAPPSWRRWNGTSSGFATFPKSLRPKGSSRTCSSPFAGIRPRGSVRRSRAGSNDSGRFFRPAGSRRLGSPEPRSFSASPSEWEERCSLCGRPIRFRSRNGRRRPRRRGRKRLGGKRRLRRPTKRRQRASSRISSTRCSRGWSPRSPSTGNLPPPRISIGDPPTARTRSGARWGPPTRTGGLVIRTPGSPSSSRHPRPFLAGVLCLLLVGLAPRPSVGDDLTERIDEILRASEPGIVRIDVRRPWSAHWNDPPPWKVDSLAALRIQGTGVVWDRNGTIVTVADLAQPGDSLHVRVGSGQPHPADYLGQDPEIGLSVIRMRDPADLVPIPRGAPDPLAPRSWTLLVGYEEDRREPHLSVSRILGRIPTEPFWRARLATSFDPRMAGSAALDGAGRWIGILLGEGQESLLLATRSGKGPVEYCMRASRPGDAAWVVPVALIAARVDSIRDGLAGREGFLGVRARLPDPDADAGGGVVIAEVIQASPAGFAGIQPEDRLTAFAGEELDGWDELTSRVAATGPGRSVRIELERNGRSRSLEVRLGDRGHAIWKEGQRRQVGGRERRLERRIEDLQRELQLLRHLATAYR
ncbi:MAG: PDZ domain-containing protein [Candidatus Eisenbacteria bacterium]|nr:PDZ domain-containing protein [Candidatus Latescibacterota bacterium]MBD3302373.1 PDZ domain-containing protein [Candidatus Eisenbacteria bacterium]